MGMKRANIYIDSEAWESLGILARLRSVTEAEPVSKSELVRRGIDREINEITRHRDPEQYEKPPTGRD